MMHATKPKRFPKRLVVSLGVFSLAWPFALMIFGALAGAALGLIAGKPGVIGGACAGWFVGLMAGLIVRRDRMLELQHRQELDDAIGVTSGDLGVADRPPRSARFPRTAVAAATGIGGADTSPPGRMRMAG